MGGDLGRPARTCQTSGMKLLNTWTGVLVVILLAIAMGAVAIYQYASSQKPTGAISAVVLLLVAMLLSRRIARRKKTPKA